MKITEYRQELTNDMMDLLLSADPDKNSILAYLPKSKILICEENKHCIGIALLVASDGLCELKNIAVSTEHQGKGIAKSIITKVKLLAKQLSVTDIQVGTGNSSLSQLALYQKCGFRMSHIESNYFESYPKPLFENGIRCIDMVRLRAKL